MWPLCLRSSHTPGLWRCLWRGHSCSVEGDGGLRQRPAEQAGSLAKGNLLFAQDDALELSVRSKHDLPGDDPEDVSGLRLAGESHDDPVAYVQFLGDLDDPDIVRASE